MNTQHSTAADRNKEPILNVLRRLLPSTGSVLEIASGTGQHAVHFSAGLPGLIWQPTDVSPRALQSIESRRMEAALTNLRPAMKLDVCKTPWPVDSADAIVNVNMVHISPWRAAEALFAGADQTLSPDGLLALYGPFKINNAHTAPSNLAFDERLRGENPQWGIRDLGELERVASAHNLALVERVSMPANNFTIVFKRF